MAACWTEHDKRGRRVVIRLSLGAWVAHREEGSVNGASGNMCSAIVSDHLLFFLARPHVQPLSLRSRVRLFHAPVERQQRLGEFFRVVHGETNMLNGYGCERGRPWAT